MPNRDACQYCHHKFDNDKHERTAEHIIPKGIIDLFPEQYISYIDDKRIVDNKGLTISDVCKNCNNTHLSQLDSYGVELIKSQFMDDYSANQCDEPFLKVLDYYLLSRWLLKIIYNERRVRKLDCSWFDFALKYILDGCLVENLAFSIFAGIHINTTPLPEEALNYLPMQINEEPQLLGSSLGMVVFQLNPYDNQLKVLSASHTYSIRFGNAVFYCILWQNDASTKVKGAYDKLLERQFKFKKIRSSVSEYALQCISVHSNTVQGYNHLVSSSGQVQDRLIIQNLLNGKTPDMIQEEFLSLMPNSELKKGNALVEATIFPENKRTKKKYDKYYNN